MDCCGLLNQSTIKPRVISALMSSNDLELGPWSAQPINQTNNVLLLTALMMSVWKLAVYIVIGMMAVSVLKLFQIIGKSTSQLHWKHGHHLTCRLMSVVLALLSALTSLSCCHCSWVTQCFIHWRHHLTSFHFLCHGGHTCVFLFFFLAADVSHGHENDVLMKRPHWVQLISLGAMGCK